MGKKRCPHDALTVRWSKRERDFLIGSPRRPDGHLAHLIFTGKRLREAFSKGGLHNVFDPSFIDELKERGYDVETLRFSVQMKTCIHEPEEERRRRETAEWLARTEASLLAKAAAAESGEVDRGEA